MDPEGVGSDIDRHHAGWPNDTPCFNGPGNLVLGCLQPDRYAEVTVAGTATQVSSAAGN